MKKLLLLASVALTICNPLAKAESFHDANLYPAVVNTYVVYDDHGGSMLSYYKDVNKLIKNHKSVQIQGNCYSACTEYIQLPKNQICIGPAGKLGFHLPTGGDVEAAKKYLHAIYPHWINQWIIEQGGLKAEPIFMDYSYASKFMNVCKSLY